MRDYCIHNNTLAIVPDGIKKAIVYEEKQVISVNRNPNSIISRNCLFHGSTLNTRLKSTHLLTGYTYKAPILIDEINKIVFFPTSSPRLKSVVWLNHEKIDYCYFDERKKMTIVCFLQGTCIEVDVSLDVMNNQILRANQLDAKFRQKQKINL